MSFFMPIDFLETHTCPLCKKPIYFVCNFDGFWFPTDISQDRDMLQWGYQKPLGTKKVAHFHRCGGDPKDPETINGQTERKKVLDELTYDLTQKLEKMTELAAKMGDHERLKAIKESPEYQKIFRQFIELQENYKRREPLP